MLRLTLIAASQRQPAWVDAGYAEYAERLRGRCSLELKVVPLGRRTARGRVERALEEEGRRMLAAVPAGAKLVALDEGGKPWSTRELAARLQAWTDRGEPLALAIGGPDGLAPEVLAQATERWSLSRLTLPHGLVRIVVAEALYRAASVLQNHPYHRA